MSLSEIKLQEFRTTIDMIDQKLVRTINRRGQMAVEYSKWEKSNAAGYLGCEDTAKLIHATLEKNTCLLYTSPSPRDLSTSRMPSSA